MCKRLITPTVLLAIFSALILSCGDDNLVNENLPTVPSNPSPADDAAGLYTNVVLHWQCGHPEGKILVYDVYFDTISPPQMRHFRWEADSLAVGYLRFERTYYWKIIAVDENYNTISGPIWRFTTSAYIDLPPDTPSLPDPADGEEDVSTSKNLYWRSTDPFGDPIYFDIYLGLDSIPPLVRARHPYSAYNPQQLIENARYYWRIVAEDSSGNRAEGPLWHFTTGTPGGGQLPPVPTSPRPDSGQMDVSPYYLNLHWFYDDYDADPATFSIYFGNTDPPPFLLNTTHNSYYFIDDTLQFNTTYYWRIKVTDIFGDSASGPVWCFTTWPDNMIYVGGYEIGSDASAIYAQGNYAYVGTSEPSLRIIDISNPANPVQTGRLDDSLSILAVAAQGDYAYLATDTYFLTLNVSDPANPTYVSRFDSPYIKAISVTGNYAYLADYYDGLKVVDISDPSFPNQVGSLGVYNASDVWVEGIYALVSEENRSLEIIRVNDPANPTLAGEYRSSSVHDVCARGNYAFFTNHYELRILDVSNPAVPVEIGDIPLSTFPNDIHASGDYVYLATNYNGVQVFDVSNPSDAHMAGVRIDPGFTQHVYALGEYIYATYTSNPGPEMRIFQLGP
jgi:hypothetical protein